MTRKDLRGPMAVCLTLATLAIMALFLSGCPGQKSALVLSRDVAASNVAFERGVRTVHQDNPEYCDNACEVTMLTVSKKIAQGGDAVTSLLQKNDQKGALIQIDSVLAAIDDAMASGLLGVKNDAKRAEWHGILLAIRANLITAKALLA